MMYNWRLEIFLHAAQSGSFGGAARVLRITPTAAIKQVNLLEKSLGMKLFLRSNQGLTLTAEGKALAQDAKYLIQYGKDAVIRAENDAQTGGRELRIGTSTTTPGQPMVRLWPRVQVFCPQTRFALTPCAEEAALAHLGEKIDVAVGVYDAALLERCGCAALELSREVLRCAVAAGHPLAEKPCLAPRDLRGQTLLMPRRGWNSAADRLRDKLSAAQPQLRVEEMAFHDRAAVDRCENFGALMLAVTPWEDVYPRLNLLPLEGAGEVSFGILHAKQPGETVQRFLNAVNQAMAIEPSLALQA